MWNVRGINAEKKQRYLDWLVSEQRPDVVMFNETKLMSTLYLDGYFSHQTMLKRSGGCITFSNLKNHRKVKALGTYMNWTKVPLGGEEVHIINVYLEPGLESFVGKRADTVINMIRSIIRQDAAAKIIVGGDLNGQLTKVHRLLVGAGFTSALEEGTVTHREGNQLDQMWTRNITIRNAIVTDLIDQVSDHSLIKVVMEVVIIEREQPPQQNPEEVNLRTLPQTTIRKIVKECVDQGLFDTSPNIAKHPLIDMVPWEVA